MQKSKKKQDPVKNRKKRTVLVVDTRNYIKGSGHLLPPILAVKAREFEFHYITERWLPGIITNAEQSKFSIHQLKLITKKLKGKRLRSESRIIVTNKLRSRLRRKQLRLTRLLTGIRKMDHQPNLVIFMNASATKPAVVECKQLDITTVAVMDTNNDPTKFNFVIPMNCESYDSYIFILNLLCYWIEDAKYQNFSKLFQPGLVNPAYSTCEDLASRSRPLDNKVDTKYGKFLTYEGRALRDALRQKLLACRAHWGHSTKVENPKMEPYIYNHWKIPNTKRKYAVIDVVKTSALLEKLRYFLRYELYRR